MNRLYPIFLKLNGRQCLVVGGGDVAKRKILSLMESGALVRSISLKFDTTLVELSKENERLTLVEKQFEESDLKGASLVIAATNNESVNKDIFNKASLLGLLINVVDRPELCNFYVPSSFTRGDLKIAVSTDGKCPALAKKIREDLERQYGGSYALLLECLAKVREELMKKYPSDQKKRSGILNKIVDSGLIDKIDNVSKDELLKEMRRWI